MTYEERQLFQRQRGGLALSTMTAMLGSRQYRASSDAKKAELMDLCNDYAYQVAKADVLGDDAAPAWVHHAQTAQRDLGISTVDYLAYYSKYGSDIMSGTSYEKTKEAVQNGLTIDEYAAYKGGISGLSADKDENGKTISGSKKEKVLSAINGMDLTPQEKDWLYYLNGYSESTIDEAPWR